MTSAKVAASIGLVVLTLGLSGCPRPPRRQPPRPTQPGAVPVDAAVSDVATGGSWREGDLSGIFRVVVRGGGRKTMRSHVVVQWLRWDDRAEQPVEVRSVPVTELGRGGIIVTGSRIEQEDGRPVIRLSIANAVTGVAGEARVQPVAVGRYRVKIKWLDQAE
jgi:hypothetical protein